MIVLFLVLSFSIATQSKFEGMLFLVVYHYQEYCSILNKEVGVNVSIVTLLLHENILDYNLKIIFTISIYQITINW